MIIRTPDSIEQFFTWLFEPVNDIVEDTTDSTAEKVCEKIKEGQFLEKSNQNIWVMMKGNSYVSDSSFSPV